VLDEDRGAILFPRWSHDGKQLSYTLITRTSPATAEQRIVILDAATSLESDLTSRVPVDVLEHAASWTPDGRFIISASTRYKPGYHAIAMLPVAAAPMAEQAARVITATAPGTLYQPSISPDQRWVAFRAGDVTGPRTSRLAVVSARGGEPETWTWLTEAELAADKPRWSADGRRLYFTGGTGGVLNLWSLPFDSEHGVRSGPPRQQTTFTGPAAQLLPDIGALEISVAGDHIVLPVVEQTGGIWISERRSPGE
jgi:Tol biopolymer transport system component